MVQNEVGQQAEEEGGDEPEPGTCEDKYTQVVPGERHGKSHNNTLPPVALNHTVFSPNAIK